MWVISPGKAYEHYSSTLGTASIEEISPNKWRWEAYSTNEWQSFDMDCWWGIAKTKEAAKQDAEKELSRWKLEGNSK